MKEFTLQTINGKDVCVVPNWVNKMTGTEEEVLTALNNIGFKGEVPKLTKEVEGKVVLADGLKLGTYLVPIHSEEGKFIGNAKVINGKLSHIFDAKGKNIFKEQYTNASDAVKKAIDDAIAKFNKGENLDQLTKYTVSQTQNGVTRFFTKEKDVATPKLRAAVSDYFNLDSQAVSAYRDGNSVVDTALKLFKAGESPEGLKLVTAESAPKTFRIGGKDTDVTFLLKEGKVDGIKIGDSVFGPQTDMFKALHRENTSAFEKVLYENEKDLQNKVYKLV